MTRAELAERWQAAWPEALTAWSKFTRLRPPRLCLSADEARREGLAGSFAMIRLQDQSIVVSLPEVARCNVGHLPVEVLAHEIGHHVLAPATLSDHAKMLARMRKALPTLEARAPMVANLYTDLLINDRLQRSAGLKMAEVYRALGKQEAGALWALYLRIYELLWSLERGSLASLPREPDDRLEGDAWLGARLVRAYARDWLPGSGRFAALLLPYLVGDQEAEGRFATLLDTKGAGAGGQPSGLSEADPDEDRGALHPALDPRLSGDDDADEDDGDDAEVAEPDPNAPPPARQSRGQARQPFEYGEILRLSGVALDDHAAAVRYYEERARPHLIPFPRRQTPQSEDPLPEGLEPWEIGMPLDGIDWLQTVLQSPKVVPGLTTVQRVYGVCEGREPATEPLDLDLYVDSSGSMPNPQHHVSFPTLAGAIVCLSALRAGARVQATLWSGKHQVTSTDGFVRDRERVLRVLTGFYGGGTAFPIHVLRETWSKRTRADRPGHVLVISDDGVSTMFDKDEKGNSGWDVSRAALANARGGGTLVLQLTDAWEQYVGHSKPYAAIQRARDELGFAVHRVATLEDLVDFARAFSRLRYVEGRGAATRT